MVSSPEAQRPQLSPKLGPSSFEASRAGAVVIDPKATAAAKGVLKCVKGKGVSVQRSYVNFIQVNKVFVARALTRLSTFSLKSSSSMQANIVTSSRHSASFE